VESTITKKDDCMKRDTSFKKYSNSDSHKIDAEEHDYLYIKESQIPESGKGLFTAIPIYKDEVVSRFKGKILSDTEAHRRVINGDDAYFINMPDGTIMDSMTVKCFAKYANDASGLIQSSFKNNSRITLDQNGKVCIVATRRISVGAEIFCGYGAGYWKNVRLKNAN
jgi:SET domain-containing protein